MHPLPGKLTACQDPHEVLHPLPMAQVPPQPSLLPQSFPAQDGVQHPLPMAQVPPQPSLLPQSFPVQDGAQHPLPT